MSRVALVLGGAIGVFLPSTLVAQAVLSGTVREDSTQRALSGVEITIESESMRATTDSGGHYSLKVPNGVRIAIFRMPGFRPVRMRVTMKGDTVRADALLVRVSATQLDPVQVNAPVRVAGLRDQFAERRERGFGKFIDSTVMRANENRRLSDVLREFARVRLMEFREPPSATHEVRAVSPISPYMNGYTVTVSPGNEVRVPGKGPCFVSVFFNGTTIYRSERGTSSGKAPDLSRDFSVASLEAVEYYRSPSETPPEFGGSNANCGALVLWSRR